MQDALTIVAIAASVVGVSLLVLMNVYVWMRVQKLIDERVREELQELDSYAENVPLMDQIYGDE